MALNTVADMLRCAQKAGLSNVDRAIAFYLTHVTTNEDKFLKDLYSLGLDTEAAGAMTVEAAVAKYIKNVVA